MKYIIIDLEWNQPAAGQKALEKPFFFQSEIIEIGAIRLNDCFEPEDEFRMFVKPQFYPILNGKIAGLTKIRPQMLKNAPTFPEAYTAFAQWCGEQSCLCSWGPDDIPVLLDNMLMHTLPIPSGVIWCDLQQIFGIEAMCDNRQWSLENAVSILGLQYRTSCIHYGQDRLYGLTDGKDYPSFEDALQDPFVSSISCPYCGEQVALSEWVPEVRNSSFSYGCCREGDELLVRFIRRKKFGSSHVIISRKAFEMNSFLWDQYQDALDFAQDPVLPGSYSSAPGTSPSLAIAC